MKKLETILPFNHFHYYAISVLIALFGYEVIWLLLLYIPFYVVIRKYRYSYIVLLIGVLTFTLLHIPLKQPPPKGDTFQVIEKKGYPDYYQYIVKNNHKYILYNNQEFQVGDYISIDYELEPFSPSRTPNGFNEKTYYASKGITYKLQIKHIKHIKSGFHFNQIKYHLMALFKDYPETTKQMIYSLIFAHNTLSGEFRENASLLGISHLFALSGMHINIIILALYAIFKKVKYKEEIILSILSLYILIIGFEISLLRAYLMVVLAYVFKKQGITTLDTLSIAFIIILLINPFNRYRLGFILSFLVTFFLIITKKDKNIIKACLIAYGCSFLIVCNINGGFYPFAVITSIIYTILFPIIIMPLVGLSLIPGFNIISNPLFEGFMLSLKIHPPLFIRMPYISLIGVVMYVGLFVALLVSKDFKEKVKRAFFLFTFIGITVIKPHIDIQGSIYFLDVGQGDSTFIKRPFNQCNILIDSHKGVTSFLKTMGFIKIDYFFITHSDYDHSSEASMVIENYRVKHVYTNPYDTLPFPIKATRKGDAFYCGDVVIDVLSPYKDYQNDNDNSLVLKLKIDEKVYLFTGDISTKVEEDLIDYYKSALKSDYLHVSHHGSNTASSISFLKYVNPKYAVISVGKNRYNHPHDEVISRLQQQNIIILTTLNNQSIQIDKYQVKKKLFIKR